MYRTYRNLYRIRPAITAIGQGKNRIRLPKGFQITLDMFLLTLVFWLPASLLAKLFLGSLIPLPSLASGAIVAGGVSMKLEKLDPSGKTLISFLLDASKYVFRGKLTDGFENQPKLQGFDVDLKIPIALMEDSHVGSLPASGYVTRFQLHDSYDVKLDSDGKVTVGYKSVRAKPLPKGEYIVKDGQLFKCKGKGSGEPPKTNKPPSKKLEVQKPQFKKNRR